MRLIAAGAAYAGVFAALHARCFAAAWDAAAFSDLFAGAGVFGAIAEDGGAPLGFVLCRAVADEAEILTIGVLPEGRGAGVGSALLRHAGEAAARLGAARMFLEVAVDNAAALALYARAGFAPVGTRRGYYRECHEGRVIQTDARILARVLEADGATDDPQK